MSLIKTICCFVQDCQDVFTQASEYMLHLNMHNLEKPLRLVCTFENCTQKLSTKYRFARHLNTHLPLATVEPPCDENRDNSVVIRTNEELLVGIIKSEILYSIVKLMM